MTHELYIAMNYIDIHIIGDSVFNESGFYIDWDAEIVLIYLLDYIFLGDGFL